MFIGERVHEGDVSMRKAMQSVELQLNIRFGDGSLLLLRIETNIMASSVQICT